MRRHGRRRLRSFLLLLPHAPTVRHPQLLDVLASKERPQRLAIAPLRVAQGGVELRHEARVVEVAREESEEEALPVRACARSERPTGVGRARAHAPSARSLRPTCRPRAAPRASAAERTPPGTSPSLRSPRSPHPARSPARCIETRARARASGRPQSRRRLVGDPCLSSAERHPRHTTARGAALCARYRVRSRRCRLRRRMRAGGG